MLTTIKGIYDHGKIVLTEEPPVKTKTDVMVTFLGTEGKKKIILGMLEGKIKLPDDFNQPLDDFEDYKVNLCK